MFGLEVCLPDTTSGQTLPNRRLKTQDDYAKYENGVFSILGRTSVDIIKSGGYRVTALEIKTQLLKHSLIVDVCVVGVPNDVWGQIVGAVVVLDDRKVISLPAIQEWCEDYLAAHQMPRCWRKVSQLNRNELGKVNKAEVLEEMFLNE